MTSDNPLLNPYELNKFFTLKNRIFMAPMTRAKASDDFEPTTEMADYYARRAAAGLIITEGTVIRPDAVGYKNVPGIFSHSQIKHWQRVTDKVHHHNGLIFLQIWHVGRVSHPSFLHGELPLSPSETLMTSKISRSNGLNYGKSRAVTPKEIEELISSYATAAENAIKAGFDGVEIHGANGYLIDQFLHHHTNLREDNYGGSPENMARFALDVVNACSQVVDHERIGMRLSPGGYLNEIIGEERDALVFKYLLEQLNKIKIAYVHTGNFNDAQIFKELNNMTMSQFVRQYYQGNLVSCGCHTFESASNGIKNNFFDLVAFGRQFIANPDLIDRYANHKTLNPYDASMLNTLI